MDIQNEISKVLTPDPGCGILNIDYSVWFPYSNPDDIQFGFGVQQPDDNGEYPAEVDTAAMADATMNHILPNKNYLTLAATNGHKTCKAGFPIQIRYSGLGASPGQFALVFYAKLKEYYMGFRVKTRIKGLNEENPYACISATLDLGDPDMDKPHAGMIMQTFKSESNGWNAYDFVIGSPFNRRESETPYTDISPADMRGIINMSLDSDECSFADASKEVVSYGMPWEKAICTFAP